MTTTWVNKANWEHTGFHEGTVRRWRVRREQLAAGDCEYTIPLRGDRGHVYVGGLGWAGVWYNTATPAASIRRLRADFPNLASLQVGDGECTFRVPMADMDRLLVRIGGMKRRQANPEQADRLCLHQFAKGHVA